MKGPTCPLCGAAPEREELLRMAIYFLEEFEHVILFGDVPTEGAPMHERLRALIGRIEEARAKGEK